MGVRRSTLHETLKEAALEKGTNVRLGLTVQDFEQHPDPFGQSSGRPT